MSIYFVSGWSSYSNQGENTCVSQSYENREKIQKENVQEEL